MKLAVAHRHGSTQPTDFTQAEAITIYRYQDRHFEPLETRPILKALHGTPAAWIVLLRDCNGVIVRSIPPRVALELQNHQIFPLSGSGFGPHGLNDALEFLARCLSHRVPSAA